MRVVTSAEMVNLDRQAIEQYGIPGLVLMENAGRHVAQTGADILGHANNKLITIVAGKGNNGGDGFVAARHLKNMGALVEVYLLADKEQVKGDARINLDAWLNMGGKVVNPLSFKVDLLEKTLQQTDLVIDALYGTGFKGVIKGEVARVVEAVNRCMAPVLAVDIPSGLEADTGYAAGVCISASHTVTFALPKVGLVTGYGPDYVGQLHIVDISIPRQLLGGGETRLITDDLVKAMFLPRPVTAHKGDFGRLLVIGGSTGMSGAVCLTAMAGARSGAGLVTAGVPAGIHEVVGVKLTEVMTKPLPGDKNGCLAMSSLQPVKELLLNSDALAIGPGLGTSSETVQLVIEILKDLKIPAVIDADGLNALALAGFPVDSIKSDVVITPHPGEMARLMGCLTPDVQSNRLGIARRAASQSGAVVVLKGAGTAVVMPDKKAYINTTGNSGMASGGSGDVLTGIIGAFLARGFDAGDAAVAGVYLHGLAGDRASAERGMPGLLASDIIEALPGVLRAME